MNKFACRQCGFVNEVEPEYNKEQEEKVKKLINKADNEIKKLKENRELYVKTNGMCNEAEEKWRQENILWRIINFVSLGAIFSSFLKQNYPELVKLSREGLVTIYKHIESVSPSVKILPNPDFKLLETVKEKWWNYSYTCQYCNHFNKFWN